MLYLFGRLALSDSLDYHENISDDDYRPAAPRERPSAPEPAGRAAADARLPRSPRPSPADRVSTGGLGK